MASIGLASFWTGPAVSDTRKIAFSSDLGGVRSIYIMDTDGTNLAKLVEGRYPDWSPDGKKIVYSFGLGRFHGDVTDVFVINANGTNRVNLTRGVASSNVQPVWSPDGTRIAFASTRDKNYEIYVMDLDGRNVRNLTLNLNDDTSPTWSRDGKKIAFSSNRVAGSDIFVMDADGANRVNLTQDPRKLNWLPSWSPDGKKIAYTAYSNVDRVGPGNAHIDIFVMNADGTQPFRLTRDAPINRSPSWSPDGRRIAFERATHKHDDSYDIYIINTDGSGLSNLTQSLGVSEWSSSWCPTPFSVLPREKLTTTWGAVKHKR